MPEQTSPAITPRHGVEVERRIIVKGWKGVTRKEFTDVSPLYSDSSVEYQRKRIGEEGLPDWQPHITEVIVEERVVTPWVETERHIAPQNGSTPPPQSAPEPLPSTPAED